MRAWVARADRRGSIEAAELPVPRPGPGEVLVRVRACGVCRTDLHVRDQDLPPHRDRVVPGHEAVGTVVAAGGETAGPAPGTLVGVPWLRSTCGTCRYCTHGQENLCPYSAYTGWDADGGYAEYVVVPAAYAYELPAGYRDEELAPLLCAGIIGYRALRRAELPEGGRLGVYGFGGSAHLTAQLAIAQGAEVHVFTRSPAAQRLALELGATSAGDSGATPPAPLDAAILFAPVGDLVPVVLEALGSGGTLSIAGIHLSAIPSLDYQRHLFRERTVRSVTANTRDDGREFLAAAGRHGVTPTVQVYPFTRADAALDDLFADRVNGAAVLRVAEPD
ncbi:zinc-dependent alcohol dehydrogenase family protein [Actinacidiphila acidipaludis]|uniref:alcohol dehydrogenase n=1 Tax=Actinacidiphila acidipaludis TaxID=2873382 RepID=A0ABS7Q5L8_9ACTN|nr:zinc-dependent alcohol dehydrogenase family protein [Streptomyces acidipaludis]MBY8878453.1 zinc-dependent alcohol dehydrogenase family protein [Streptomyces acidipaludis]